MEWYIEHQKMQDWKQFCARAQTNRVINEKHRVIVRHDL
jgi:hypothetical protein